MRAAAKHRVNVPYPKQWLPFVGHIRHFLKTDGDFHQTTENLRREYGDTYALSIPMTNTDFVFTHDAELTKAVLLSGGEDSQRDGQWYWMQVFEEMGWPRDIPNDTGDSWRAKRFVLNRTLAQVSSSKAYLPVVRAKAERLASAIEANLTPDGRLANDLTVRSLFSLYALETIMAVTVGVDEPLLPTGEGLTPSRITMEEGKVFAANVESMFMRSDEIEHDMLARWMPHRRDSYNGLKQCWIDIYATAAKLMKPSIEEYVKSGASELKYGKEAISTMLPQLMAQKTHPDPALRLTEEEIMWIAMISAAAAVDTTSQSLEYIHAHIGKHHGALTNLQKETDRSGADSYGDGPVVRATVKESMRLTPTVGAHQRKLTRPVTFTPRATAENPNPQPITLPKDDVVVMLYKAHTMDERYFSVYPADVFEPGRFDKAVCPISTEKSEHQSPPPGCPMHAKGSEGSSYHAFAANAPFGHGVRRCPGAGIAQLLVQAGIAAVTRRFDLRYDGEYPLRTVQKQLERPAKPISPHLVFEKRR